MGPSERSVRVLAVLCLAAAPAASFAECPSATRVSQLRGGSEYEKAGPFELASVTKATATKSAFGLTVFLSDADFDAKAAAQKLTVSPVKGKGQLVLAITFMNAGKPIVVGDYAKEPAVLDPMNIRADLGFGGGSDGFMYGLTTTKGTGSITELGETQVCGSFALEAGNGAVAGQFTATLPQ